jgi:hypothetical protein
VRASIPRRRIATGAIAICAVVLLLGMVGNRAAQAASNPLITSETSTWRYADAAHTIIVVRLKNSSTPGALSHINQLVLNSGDTHVPGTLYHNVPFSRIASTSGTCNFDPMNPSTSSTCTVSMAAGDTISLVITFTGPVDAGDFLGVNAYSDGPDLPSGYTEIAGNSVLIESLPRICFYADQPHTYPTGHAFVQMLPDRGSQAGLRTLVYGFHPKSDIHFVGSPGEIRSNATHHWDWKICYVVSVAQYNAAAAAIRAKMATPGTFALFSTNCTKWAASIARVAGVPLPSTRGARLAVPNNPALKFIASTIDDPVVFGASLQAIGAGGTYMGTGTVFHNTTGVTPSGAADPPPDHLDTQSYAGLTALGLRDPFALAHGLRLTAHIVTGRPLTLGTNKTLRFEFAGATARTAILAVDWGDGSATTATSSPRHVYRHSGSFKVRAIVIEPGTDVRAQLTVIVSAGAPKGIVTVRVPRDRLGRPFPPGPSAPPAPEAEA